MMIDELNLIIAITSHHKGMGKMLKTGARANHSGNSIADITNSVAEIVKIFNDDERSTAFHEVESTTGVGQRSALTETKSNRLKTQAATEHASRDSAPGNCGSCPTPTAVCRLRNCVRLVQLPQVNECSRRVTLRRAVCR